jgi:hypothetical protein
VLDTSTEVTINHDSTDKFWQSEEQPTPEYVLLYDPPEDVDRACKEITNLGLAEKARQQTVELIEQETEEEKAEAGKQKEKKKRGNRKKAKGKAKAKVENHTEIEVEVEVPEEDEMLVDPKEAAVITRLRLEVKGLHEAVTNAGQLAARVDSCAAPTATPLNMLSTGHSDCQQPCKTHTP